MPAPFTAPKSNARPSASAVAGRKPRWLAYITCVTATPESVSIAPTQRSIPPEMMTTV